MERKGLKDCTIDGCDIELPDLEFEAYWMYYHSPAQMYGDPNECHEGDTDCEISCVHAGDYVDTYLANIREMLIRKIENRCLDMETEGLAAQWAKEQAAAEEEDRAESQCQDAKERGERV